MYKIATLNKISPIGLEKFTDKYEIIDGAEGIQDSAGVLVRSQAMHDMEFQDTLLAIARAGAGVNNIPTEKCADQGIVVFNTPGANANSVKELVLGALIMSARNMDQAISWTQSLKDDPEVQDISKAVEKGKSKFAGHEIQGKTLGVLGLGAIGAMVANSAIGLGMKVVGYDPYLTPQAKERLLFDVKTVDTPEELLPLADFVTIHIPSMESTNGMINKEMLNHFKDGAIFLNFSRDKLVVEEDILAALASGKIAKYVTDFATAGIFGVPGVTIMPHLGASTEEAEDNCAIMAAEELMAFIEEGTIKNSVNYPPISLDSEIEAKTRALILTKNEPHPEKLASAMFADKEEIACVGSVRGDYGAAIFATNDEITEAPDIPEVVKVRIISND